jgi:hypothetical protein
MKSLRSFFRRNRPPVTPTEGRVRADKLAAELFTHGGLNGFLLAATEASGTDQGEITMHVHSLTNGLETGLTKVIRALLSRPEAKEATLKAIFAALNEAGSARVLRVILSADDCPCPLQPTGKPH